MEKSCKVKLKARHQFNSKFKTKVLIEALRELKFRILSINGK